MIETTTEPTVVAVFKHRAQAHRAVDALLEAGFATDQIRLEDHGGQHDHLTHQEAEASVARSWPVRFVAVGAGLGGGVGAAAAWLMGWTRRVIELPPRRDLLARMRRRGVLGPALIGIGLGAAGGYALAEWMRPPAPRESEPVDWYEGSLERGRAVVQVRTDSRGEEVEAILKAYGGRGVHRLAQAEPIEPVVT
jgi:hypothetical protein